MIQIANALGFSALLFFIIGLIPTNARIIFPRFKISSIHKLLIKGRRYIGLTAFFLSLGHAYLIVRQGNFDFYDLETFSNFSSGIILGISFFILAITSTERSQKKLGISNWRRLHHWLSYTGLFTLGWHVLDKMRDNYSIFTWPGLILLAIIALLYGLRKYLELNLLNPREDKGVVQKSRH